MLHNLVDDLLTHPVLCELKLIAGLRVLYFVSLGSCFIGFMSSLQVQRGELEDLIAEKERMERQRERELERRARERDRNRERYDDGRDRRTVDYYGRRQALVPDDYI